MRRLLNAMVLACLATQLAAAQAPSAAGRRETLAYLHGLQRDDGAFLPDRQQGAMATLGSTLAGMRATKYLGGELSRKDACAKFIRACRDEPSGGFAPTPGGQPDVRSTALGIMAAKELEGIRFDDDLQRAVTYLAKHAQSFDDRRIAAAAFEAKGLPDENTRAEWIQAITAKRNADGTFGQGGSLARDTGSSVVTLLRLGARLESADAAARTLRSGQRADGGWGKDESASDLETTYRVMRAFVMLKAKPDLTGCRAFVAKCRNADGGFGVQPGQASNVNATYYAAIIGSWIDKMGSE